MANLRKEEYHQMASLLTKLACEQAIKNLKTHFEIVQYGRSNEFAKFMTEDFLDNEINDINYICNAYSDGFSEMYKEVAKQIIKEVFQK